LYRRMGPGETRNQSDFDQSTFLTDVADKGVRI
jgi:hypothetical protein